MADELLDKIMEAKRDCVRNHVKPEFLNIDRTTLNELNNIDGILRPEKDSLTCYGMKICVIEWGNKNTIVVSGSTTE
ncbi:MAG: hypothetical protein CL666_08805 [Balneola sp.]|nr:hypothetical protein [Balneola sp.]|tara:strand:+ start:669 stop:899 length:231 start_codon:yes stop_codon:yes gene_type:complete